MTLNMLEHIRELEKACEIRVVLK